jgi:hypothetical protein
MARIKGPLMSLSASGALGRDLLFRSGRKAGHVYRPADPCRVNQAEASAPQAAVRAVYRQAAASWRVLDPSQRAAWQARAAASGTGATAWNLYLADFHKASAGPATARIRLTANNPVRLLTFGADIAATTITLSARFADLLATGA